MSDAGSADGPTSDADIPEWYSRYVMGSGRFLGYVVGLAFVASSVVGAFLDASTVTLSYGVETRLTFGAALLGAVVLFAFARDVYGSRVFFFGVVTQLSEGVLHVLLVDAHGFAAGSLALLVDVALVVVTALVLSYVLVFDGLAADAKQRLLTAARGLRNGAESRQR